MASKTLLLLGFLLVAMFLVVSSEVAPREPGEETKEKTVKDGLEDQKDGGVGGVCGPGRGFRHPIVVCRPPSRCCCRGIHGGCWKCCRLPDEVPNLESEAEPTAHN